MNEEEKLFKLPKPDQLMRVIASKSNPYNAKRISIEKKGHFSTLFVERIDVTGYKAVAYVIKEADIRAMIKELNKLL